MQWIVARVRDVNRFAATQSILRRLNNQWDFRVKFNMGFDAEAMSVYWPCRTIPTYKRGKLVTENVPKVSMMPGYLFVRCDPSARSYEAVKYANCVIEILTKVGDTEHAEPITDAWVDYIRSCEERGDFDEVARILEAALLKEAARRKNRQRKCRGLESLKELRPEILGEIA